MIAKNLVFRKERGWIRPLFNLKKQQKERSEEMSHFTTVQTRITDLNLLESVMKSLGLRRVERNIVNGYAGQRANAEHVWQVDKWYDVGASKNADGTYDLVADWWGVGENLKKKILQEYSLRQIIRTNRKMGRLGHGQPVKEECPNGDIIVRIPVQGGELGGRTGICY